MDDRQAQFLIAVGDLCVAAGLAGLEVRLLSTGGGDDVAHGVPHARHASAGDGAVNDTSYASALLVDDHIVNLEDVLECTIFAPAGDPSGRAPPSDQPAAGVKPVTGAGPGAGPG